MTPQELSAFEKLGNGQAAFEGLEPKVSGAKWSGFACQECGHKFKTLAAAERASFGPNGCPKCGGSDIDEGLPHV